MLKTNLCTPRAEVVLEVLPSSLSREIRSVAGGRVGGLSSVSEIRVRSGGICSLVFSEGQLPLQTRVGEGELYSILSRLTDSSLYAYRDTITHGFISMPRGVRVGVCGHARSEGGELTVSNVGSLIFRIPPDRVEIAEKLYSAYREARGGIIIYSPPGVGKTTALRSLAENISRRDGTRIVVVDERSEFCREDFSGLTVDIVSGYSRGAGISLAVRTLGAELIMVDELMGDECREIEYSALSGVPVIATAHAGSVSELFSKKELARLISVGIFSTFIGIFKNGGRYNVTVSGEGVDCLSI